MSWSTLERMLKKRLTPVLNDLSGFPSLRRGSEEVKNRVRERWPRCAICGEGQSEARIVRLEVAHITPVQEAGRYLDSNLLSLCVRARRSLGAAKGDPHLVGCHDLFDKEGVWSRGDIRARLLCGPQEAAKLTRPTRQQHEERITDRREQAEHFIATRRVAQASEVVEELTKELGSDPALRSRLGRRTAHRTDRDRCDASRRELIERSAAAAARDYAKTEKLEYEIGMTFFEKRDFAAAVNWLHRVNQSGRERSPAAPINDAQAVVAEFEHAHRSGREAKSLDRIVRAMRYIIGFLDEAAKACPTHTILQRWTVTARLHTARMIAECGKNGEDWIDAAMSIRDTQDAYSGWAWYTEALLLHALGATDLLRNNYGDALTHLALAGRTIVNARYKRLECLENVLDLMLKIPPEVFPNQSYAVGGGISGGSADQTRQATPRELIEQASGYLHSYSG